MTDAQSRQTLSFLRRRFREAGIRPHTKRGQNFLIDLNLLRVLFESAAVDRNDVVLEVGTGTGSLTAMLAQAAAAVVTVEIDPAMFELAAEELHRLDNVVMLRTDALQGKNRLNPAVVEAVRGQLAAAPGRRWKLVANLPYHVATPVLGNLLGENQPPRTMTVTIQKELAQRITARPGSKDYIALSIWVQAQSPGGRAPHLAAGSVLAAAEGGFRLPPDRTGRHPSRPHRRPEVLSRFRPRHVPPSPQVPPLGVAHRREGAARQDAGQRPLGPVGPRRHGPGRAARRRELLGAVQRIRESGTRD